MKPITKIFFVLLITAISAVAGCLGEKKVQRIKITPAGELKILFEDNFTDYDLGSDASPVWSLVKGGKVFVTKDTQPDGKVGKVLETKFGYFQESFKTFEFVSAGSESWQDYVFQVMVKCVTGSPGSSGVVFRVQDSGRKHYFLGLKENIAKLYKVINGVPAKIGEMRLDLNLKGGRWYKITVMVDGDKIYANIDGHVIFDGLTDDDPEMRNGKIGLSGYEYGWIYHYDDVLVLELNDAAKRFYKETLSLSRKFRESRETAAMI